MKNKNIVIFGSSGDVGLSLAKNYLSQGYNLILTYNKNLKILKNTLNLIKIIKVNYFSQNVILKMRNQLKMY